MDPAAPIRQWQRSLPLAAGEQAWADDPRERNTAADEPPRHLLERDAADGVHAPQAHVKHGALRASVQPRQAVVVRRAQGCLLCSRSGQQVQRPDHEGRERELAPDLGEPRCLDPL